MDQARYRGTVLYTLLVYDRAELRLVDEQTFDNKSDALQARFDAEARHHPAEAIEVVVLVAKTREDLIRTHSRYFRTLQELTQPAP
jgi:hypothetical protein